jgi:hypothetical protein
MRYFLAILIISAFHFSVLGQAKARYKISSEYCKDNKCSVRAYVAPKDYDEANMKMLAEELAAKYKDKEVVNLRVFDDEKIIEAYVKGVREPINVGSDSRAYFIHYAVCGDMLFYKSKNDKVKLVKISWNKNEEKCKKPFSVF